MDNMPVRDRKRLYLLHGLSEDGSAWVRHSMIETIAREYGLVVIMPSVGRSFYADQRDGQAYFTYLVDELPAYLDAVFGLTPKWQDTLIAGNSMGGYGALKLALNYPERFAAVASFSGVTSLEFLRLYPDDPRNAKFAYLFGDLNQLHGGPHDPMTWLNNVAQQKERLPELYVACGIQDDLFPLNEIFHSACLKFGINHQYVTEDGKHDWFFWNKHIRQFLRSSLGEPKGGGNQ
jgi:S-formylglutathione hydrolase FrmB